MSRIKCKFCYNYNPDSKKCLIKKTTVRLNKSRKCEYYREDAVAIMERLNSLEATARRSPTTFVNLEITDVV